MSTGSLHGKISIVTGGAGGVGRASSLLFSQEGARVAVLNIHVSGTATVAEIEAAGGGAK